MQLACDVRVSITHFSKMQTFVGVFEIFDVFVVLGHIFRAFNLLSLSYFKLIYNDMKTKQKFTNK